MINLDDNETNLLKAFHLTEEDTKAANEFNNCIDRARTVTWYVRRIWIDEKMSENLKCYLIFLLGRAYEQSNQHLRGGE